MELSLNEFVLAVLVACLLLVAVLSLLSRFLHHRMESKQLRGIIICRSCGYLFVAPTTGNLCQCPACHKSNFRHSNGKLG
jgi:predicted Zn-ribbon and HTH transcriptional regulator